MENRSTQILVTCRRELDPGVYYQCGPPMRGWRGWRNQLTEKGSFNRRSAPTISYHVGFCSTITNTHLPHDATPRSVQGDTGKCAVIKEVFIPRDLSPFSVDTDSRRTMISKLLFRSPARNKEESKRGPKIESRRQPGIHGMYFDTSSTNQNDFHLLPEESCLAEDEKSIFGVHCEREGFHLFGWGNINFTNIHAKVYLTNYRVNVPPTFRL